MSALATPPGRGLLAQDWHAQHAGQAEDVPALSLGIPLPGRGLDSRAARASGQRLLGSVGAMSLTVHDRRQIA